jgi:AcrR family transcriptional regulator
MPTETFYNLPDDKKNKIILAAKHEFTENVLLKARVSNIIKRAGIPRGSFYQYFEDLEDLYYFVIDELFDNFYNEGKGHSEVTSDLFEFALYSFEYDYNAYSNDKRHQFVMNVLKSISNNEEYVRRFQTKRINYIQSILNTMDLSKIRFKEQEDLIKMYQMIQDIKRNVIRKSMIDNMSKEEAIVELKWYLDILKNGLCLEE